MKEDARDEHIQSLERGAALVVTYLGNMHLRLGQASDDVQELHKTLRAAEASLTSMQNLLKVQVSLAEELKRKVESLERENEALRGDRAHAEGEVEKLLQKLERYRETDDTPL